MASLYTSHSAEETSAIGYAYGQQLPPGSVICFFGDLAAGKTTFIKGLVEGASAGNREEVVSPTFVYLNIYNGERTVYHFDLYRLKGEEEFLSMGFDEFLFAGGICCIEWSERISSLLPKHCIHINISHLQENSREIVIT